MSPRFAGEVLLPGETGDGHHALFEIDEDFVCLVIGESEIGSWGRDQCGASPTGRGSFLMNLGGEELLFTPSSPATFAEALDVPYVAEPRPEPEDEVEKPKYDFDAALDEIAVHTQREHEMGDGDILSKGVYVSIVGLSTVVIGALAAVLTMV